MIGRSEGVIAKRRMAYEAAKAEAEAQIARYDNFGYLWMALRQTLEVFDERGGLPALTSRQAEIDAIVTLMDTLDDGALHQTLVSFASGLEGYWSYYQRAEQVYQACMARYPRDVVQALACGWQLARQATNSKA